MKWAVGIVGLQHKCLGKLKCNAMPTLFHRFLDLEWFCFALGLHTIIRPQLFSLEVPNKSIAHST